VSPSNVVVTEAVDADAGAGSGGLTGLDDCAIAAVEWQRPMTNVNKSART
jgi:hypothetical protein